MFQDDTNATQRPAFLSDLIDAHAVNREPLAENWRIHEMKNIYTDRAL